MRRTTGPGGKNLLVVCDARGRYATLPGVDLELDHVIVFVPGPDAVEPAWFPGCTVEPGQRHTGQGTRNRRVVFPRTYVELLWIDDPEAHAPTGLRYGPRCAREAGACPFGVVLRGRIPESARGRFVDYVVPGGGPSLLLLRAALERPELPFVAVGEAADEDLPARWPAHRFDPAFLHHPGGARGIRRATLHSRALPDLGALRPRDVAFAPGPPGLRLEVDGVGGPWTVGAPA